ncbi:MAG TPA: DNA-formamidopyrimidine glycosylase family protein [Acidimicrobiales bacterium]|nr:DNA-formamidopyrimidine glycosylase family protein [Acidimicrobiales bacterium]
MPELPEVASLVDFLNGRATGHTIAKVRVGAIAALKTFDPPIDALEGRTIDAVARKGKFLLFDTAGTWLVIHLARGGWLRWSEAVPQTPIKPNKSPLALRVVLDDGSGFDVTEMGTEKRLQVHVVRDPMDIEHVATLGPDALGNEFTLPTFVSVLDAAGGAQIKGVLVDQRRIAGIGNAYSDEALHVAKLSPFKHANKLTADETQRLHRAIVAVLGEALERSAGLPAAELKSEKKSGMRVHGRTGESCPECGDVVREVSFSSKSLQYCATCQTDGKPLADRRLSKLLK